MKHKIIKNVRLIFFVLIIVSNYTYSQDYLKEQIENGKVKSVKITTYELIDKFGEIVKGEKISGDQEYRLYDRNGNLIEKRTGSDGKCYSSCKTYKYDKKGNLLEKLHYVSDHEWCGWWDENYDWSQIFDLNSKKYVKYGKTKYDTLGNEIEYYQHNKYSSDRSLAKKITRKYDSRGNEIEKNRYDSDGRLISKKTWKYDSRGNEIENNEYSSDGSLEKKITRKYDSRGNEIENNEYSSDGSLCQKTTWKYDSSGNEIEYEYYSIDGKYDEKITRKYDSRGNIIEEKEYSADGSLNLKTTWNYEYDSRGNILTENENSSDGTYSKSAMEYDLHGNIIKDERESKIKKHKYNSPDEINYSKSTVIFEYDSQGNKLENMVWNIYSADGSLKYKYISKYNNEGNIIERKHYEYKSNNNEAYDKTTYKYKYNESGIWISTTKYYNGIPKKIKEQILEYF